MAGKLIEYPFDTVKVELTPNFANDRFACKLSLTINHCNFVVPWTASARPSAMKAFWDFIEYFYSLCISDGQGLSPPMLGAMAENATLFLTYNRAQNFFRSNGLFIDPSSNKLSFTGLVVAGAISGACTSYVLTPIELVKCKLQVQNVGSYTPGTTTFTSTSSSSLKRNPSLVPNAAIHTSAIKQPGPLQLISQIYRAQGFTGFWRGQMGTFLRETGGSAAWFGTYEYVSSLLKAHRHHTDLTTPDLMLSGACAGMGYNLVLFPADSVKSRMQTDSISDAVGSRGFWQVGKEMWRYGGVGVFYRGCFITVLRAAPASAIIFWTYESLKNLSK